MKHLFLLTFALLVTKVSAQVSTKKTESVANLPVISFTIKKLGKESKNYTSREVVTNSYGQPIQDIYGNRSYTTENHTVTAQEERVYCFCDGKMIDSVTIFRYSDDSHERVYLDNYRSHDNSYSSIKRLEYILTDKYLRLPSCNKAYSQYRGRVVFKDFGTFYTNMNTWKSYNLNDKALFSKYLENDCPIDVESQDCANQNLGDQIIPYIQLLCEWKRPDPAKREGDIYSKLATSDTTAWMAVFNQYIREVQENGNSMYTGFMVCGRQVKWNDYVPIDINYFPDASNPTRMVLIPRRFLAAHKKWLVINEEEQKKNKAGEEKRNAENKARAEIRKNEKAIARRAVIDKAISQHRQDVEQLFTSSVSKDAQAGLISEEWLIVDSKTNQQYDSHYKSCSSAEPKKDFFQIRKGYAVYKTPSSGLPQPVSYPDTVGWLTSFNKNMNELVKNQKKTGYMVCDGRMAWKDFVVVERFINPDDIVKSPGHAWYQNYYVVMVPRGFEKAYQNFRTLELKREEAMYAPLIEKIRSRYIGYPTTAPLNHNQKKAAEFMEKVIEAYGGMKRFQTIHTITKVFDPDAGFFTFAPIPAGQDISDEDFPNRGLVNRFVISHQKGFFKHFEYEFPKGDAAWDMWYKKDGDIKGSRLPAHYGKTSHIKAGYDGELDLQQDPFFYTKRPTDFSWVGMEKLDLDTLIKIVDEGYPKQSLYFDPVSYRLHCRAIEHKTYPDGKIWHEMIYYCNYKFVDGILYPFVVISRTKYPGNREWGQSTERYFEITHNLPVEDKLFETGK